MSGNRIVRCLLLGTGIAAAVIVATGGPIVYGLNTGPKPIEVSKSYTGCVTDAAFIQPHTYVMTANLEALGNVTLVDTGQRAVTNPVALGERGFTAGDKVTLQLKVNNDPHFDYKFVDGEPVKLNPRAPERLVSQTARQLEMAIDEYLRNTAMVFPEGDYSLLIHFGVTQFNGAYGQPFGRITTHLASSFPEGRCY